MQSHCYPHEQFSNSAPKQAAQLTASVEQEHGRQRALRQLLLKLATPAGRARAHERATNEGRLSSNLATTSAERSNAASFPVHPPQAIVVQVAAVDNGAAQCAAVERHSKLRGGEERRDGVGARVGKQVPHAVQQSSARLFLHSRLRWRCQRPPQCRRAA